MIKQGIDELNSKYKYPITHQVLSNILLNHSKARLHNPNVIIKYLVQPTKRRPKTKKSLTNQNADVPA